MDYKQFMGLLEHDDKMERESIPVLQQFVNEFPYFQTAHSLLAKAMHGNQHVRFEKELKIASAYSADRKSLHNLIHPKKITLFSDQPVITETNNTPEQPVEEVTEDKIFATPDEKVLEKGVAEANIEMPVEDVPINNSFDEPIDELIDEPASPEEIASPAVIHSLREEIEMPEAEPEDYYDEPPVADPHEIIRRRLNEILGYAGEIRKENKPEPVIIHDEPAAPIQEEIRTEASVDIEELKAETTSEEPEKDIIEKIASESKNAIDVIDKGELEYALEASIIQSLEKLPLIEKPERKQEEKPVEKEITEETRPAAPQSFIGWLKKKSEGGYGLIEEVHAYDIDKNPEPVAQEEITKTDSSEEPEKRSVVNDLIDRFIESDPKIVPSKAEFYSPFNQAKKSVTEQEDIVSETLAKIYRQQGNLEKARTSYQKLSLLYPEKMAYFAALISEIDKEINNTDKHDS